MKRSEAIQFAAIIKAWGEGETIEVCIRSRWTPFLPHEEDIKFNGSVRNYRIKPKSVKKYWAVIEYRLGGYYVTWFSKESDRTKYSNGKNVINTFETEEEV